MTTFVSAAGAIGNTLTIPAHQPGDFLLAAVGRFSSTSAITVPDHWRLIGMSTMGLLRASLCCKTAITSTEDFGVFSNAELVAIAVYRPATNQIAGTVSTFTGSLSNSTFDYFRPPIVGSDSWAVYCTWTKLNTTNIDSAHPETLRLAIEGELQGGIYIHDTNAAIPIGLEATFNASVSGGPTGYQSRGLQLFDCPGFLFSGFTGILGLGGRLGT